MTLDGELFGGRGQFQSTVSIVKTINSPHWKGITFQVGFLDECPDVSAKTLIQIFDIPSHGDKPFEERVEILKKIFGPGGSHASNKVAVVEHTLAKDKDHVLAKLKEIETLGGEGLMLRKAESYAKTASPLPDGTHHVYTVSTREDVQVRYTRSRYVGH